MNACQVEIIAGPLTEPPPDFALDLVDAAGAIITFAGVVRPLEDGRPLAALRYEAYEPMATRELQLLATRIHRDHGLLALRAQHSSGQVAVGQVSFRLVIASRHRQEGLAALGAFIDDLKRLVPIWKTPVWPAPSPESSNLPANPNRNYQ